jgi:hypothetical protein
LPALASAREKARRSSCVANLNQIGKAMEAYLGDYGMYYPGWTGMGGKPKDIVTDMRVTWERGLYKDIQTNQAVSPLAPVEGFGATWVPPAAPSGGTAAWSWPLMSTTAGNWRGLFQGVKLSGAAWTKGNLNVVPVGTAFLLAGNYISDVASFYCPSAPAMGVITGGPWSSVTDFSGVKRLGGTTAKDIMFGEWAWAPTMNGYNYSPYSPASCDRRGLHGQYNYRNMPGMTYTNPFNSARDIQGTKPRVRSQWTSPDFVTQRFLADRALLSDTFEKGFATYHGYGTTPCIPNHGAVLFHHKDGYNVVYGDYHAAWYGDPQQKIACGAVIGWNGSSYDGWAVQAGAAHLPYSFDGLQGTYIGGNSLTQGRLVWHFFDEAAGIDVGVDASIVSRWP